jgi:ketosteroid isomerase-like protein
VTAAPLTLAQLDAQEQAMAAAFAAGDVTALRPLYHPDVVYLSPTTRLYDQPARIVGVDRALEFIALTICGISDVAYRVDERALIPDDPMPDDPMPDARGAYVRVFFDFSMGAARLRSVYVVVYRYRDGLIGQQELYYDPSARLDPVPG